MRLLVSGYNDSANDPGIFIYDIDPGSGEAVRAAAIAGVVSPSFCQATEGKLYAASETPDQGGLAVFTDDPNSLPVLESQVSFEGAAGTCFVLAHDHPSDYIYGADYNSGSVSIAELDGNGSLRNDPDPEDSVRLIQHAGHSTPRKPGDPHFDRQLSPHVHTLSFVPGTDLLAAVDLGLDLLVLYKMGPDGQITDSPDPTYVNESPDSTTDLIDAEEVSGADHAIRIMRTIPDDGGFAIAELPVRPAAVVEVPIHYGPRIIAYHPTKPLVALICELGCKVLIYRIGDHGRKWTLLEEHDLLQDAPNIGKDGKPPLSAHCEFSADGRFLYTSTRGTDQMIVFAVEGEHLTQIQMCYCGGDTPRHFALSTDGSLVAVANQISDDVSILKRDAVSGKLEMLGQFQCSIHPSCVVWE